MTNDKIFVTEDTVRLLAFGARKTSERTIIKCLDMLTIKLNSDTKSHTKGSIKIKGQTIPILPNKLSHGKPNTAISEGASILLLDGNQSFTNFQFGVIVDDILNIPKITKAYAI